MKTQLGAQPDCRMPEKNLHVATSHKVHAVYLEKLAGGKLRIAQRSERTTAPCRSPQAGSLRQPQQPQPGRTLGAAARTTQAGDLCPTSELHVTFQRTLSGSRATERPGSDTLMVPLP